MARSTGGYYYPRSDPDFLAWGEQFNTYVQAHFSALGLGPGDVLGLNADLISFSAAHEALVKARAEAAAALETRTRARRKFAAAVRTAVRRVQAHPGTTDAHRANLGITVPDRERTPVTAPTGRPLVKVDVSKRLLHRIAFVDEKTPTRRARPAGVMGAEIWVKVGDPAPVDPSELTFLAVDTKTPYLAEYGGADGGKNARYMLRRINSTGEKGPWSETVSATISA